MTHWTVAAPTALDFDEVTELNVRLTGGTVAVLASVGQRPFPGETPRSPEGTAPDPLARTPRGTLVVSGNVGAGTGHGSVTSMSGAVTLLRGVSADALEDDSPSPPVAGMESKTL